MKEEKARKIELKTDRLIIRTPDEKDAHDVFVLMSDLEIAESTPQGDGWRTNVLYFGKWLSGKSSRCF